MNNPMNRKLFKPRTARNKLNQMGGIMASDAELMQTVARYNVGGPVRPGAGLKSAMPGSMTAAQYRMASPTVQQQLLDAENRYRTINRVSSGVLNVPKGIVDLATNAGAGIANLVTSGAQGLGLVDPTQDYSVSGTNLVGSNIEQGLSFPEVNNPEEYAALLATSRGEFQDPAIQRAVDQQAAQKEQEAISAQLGQDIVGDYSMSAEESPFMMPGVTPAQTAEDTRKPVITPEKITAEQAAATEAAGAVTTAEIEAAKTSDDQKTQTQAITLYGTREERQEAMKTLMAEFTENAPKYEGMNRGLALAKIGFAMAAGKSPNALSNIASALEQGADMFIKDKKDRDAFNRQVQLSAMQYGLGEISKQTAEARLEAREGRKPTFWVADKDMTFNGKSYKEGETVAVPTSYIQEKGLPEGVTLPAMAKAAMDFNATVQKALDKQLKDGVMKPANYRANSEAMTQAATDFSTSNRLREITQSQLVNVAEGKITGLANASAGVINNAASAVGVNLSKRFQSVEEYNAAMQKVANQLVNDLLGEGSKTMSDMDRRLAQEIVGFYGSSLFNYTFADPDVLKDRLQGTLVEVENKNRRALNTMRDIMDASAGYTLKSGKPVVYREALSVAGPYLSEDVRSDFGLTKVGEENGIPVYDFSK